jgi:hypothetical protein
VKDGFVNPELLSWHLSGAVLIMIILGGLGHLRGALIGAFAFALLQEFFKSEAVFGAFAKHWHLGLGLTIIAQRGLLPRGLVGLPAQWRCGLGPQRAGGPRRRPEACLHQKTGEVLLRGRGLTRRWGGLVAVNEVSLDLRRGEVHAVIGTNGAGKSTLINMLSGEIPPSAGRCSCWASTSPPGPQPRRARAGLGRSYQRNTIYPTFTVFENCRLAAQAAHQKPWRWWQDAQPLRRQPRPPRAWPPARRAWPTCSSAGRPAVARPEAPARDRDVPGHRPRRCCCSTSRWPAWAPRKPTAC